MLFLVNPGHRGKRRGGVSRRKALTILRDGAVRGRTLTAKQRRFFGARARGAPTQRERSRSRARVRTTRSVTQGDSMARRRKRAHSRRKSTTRRTVRRSAARRQVPAHRRRYKLRTSGRHRVVRTNPRRHRRRGIHRNPPGLSLRSLKGMLVEGTKDALGIIAGRAATRAIKKFVPITQDTMVKQVAVGVLASVVAGYGLSMWNRRIGQLALAAGLADTISPVLVGLPVIGTYLGDSFLGDSFLGAAGAYPQISAYPQMAGVPMTTGASVMAEDGAY